MLILVLNCGSSSVKCTVLDPATGQRRLTALAQRLGEPDAALRCTVDGQTHDAYLPQGNHEAAIAAILQHMHEHGGLIPQLGGVGHRVVHGGSRFASSIRIDDAVLRDLEAITPLAPLHQPPNLLGIRLASKLLPDLPQVAVFDTAFHQTMPPRAYRYAVPAKWHDELGVRRYGFHGTSFRYVCARAAELLDRPLEELAIVAAHLGNGCSASAVLNGRCVDTTMGLTPLEGLVMGTRSGDVDPSLHQYLAARAGMTLDDITAALNRDSGLLGVSGLSNDMRTLLDAARDGHAGAALAIDMFCYRLARAVAALVVPLGRLDILLFTGGIGEHAAPIRMRVIDQLRHLGLSLSAQRNTAHGRDTHGIITDTTPGNTTPPAFPLAIVVPTDEEAMIAQDTIQLVMHET